jgi:hypothetical protein
VSKDEDVLLDVGKVRDVGVKMEVAEGAIVIKVSYD